MKTKQQGFTLIELIVVIVILGILSAIALPRFLNVANDARASVMRGVQGSMTATNSMVYGKAAINGQLGAAGNLTALQLGTTQNIPTVWGYASTATTLARGMDINTAATGDFQIVGNAIRHRRAPTPATCAVTYTPAASAAIVPLYAIVTTGC